MFDFLSSQFSSIFNTLGNGKLTEKNIQESLDQVQQALLEADVPHALVQTFCGEVKEDVLGQKVLSAVKPGQQFIKVLNDRLKSFLGDSGTGAFSFQIPSVILLMGLQGSGKTTLCSKVAYWIKQEANKRGKDRSVLLASVDYYRPAAIEQLEIGASQAGVSFYRSTQQSPVKAAADILAYYKKHQFDHLILDTAGRLHVDNAMLLELQEIQTLVNSRYRLMVLDAMTGQESLNVAKAFEQAIGFDMGVLTKMDSDTRGGAAFSFRYALKKPIIFVGVGEKLADLELFYPDRMAGRILGMGDITSLVEKAEDKITKEDQQKAMKALTNGKFTLQDFADQMGMINKLGSFSQVMKYLPGMSSVKITPDMMQKGEVEIKKFKAIINSMTPKERLNHRLLDSSRKNRIARGAGVVVADIAILLDRFEQSQQYVKLMKKFGPFQGLFK